MKKHKAKRLLIKLRISSHNLHRNRQIPQTKKTPFEQFISVIPTLSKMNGSDGLHLILDCTLYDKLDQLFSQSSKLFVISTS